VEQRLLEQSGFPDFDAWCRDTHGSGSAH
jgi:hypothetical protein